MRKQIEESRWLEVEMMDIVFIEEIIGVGEIAISDHRGSQPTIEELIRLTSDARVDSIKSSSDRLLTSENFCLIIYMRFAYI